MAAAFVSVQDDSCLRVQHKNYVIGGIDEMFVSFFSLPNVPQHKEGEQQAGHHGRGGRHEYDQEERTSGLACSCPQCIGKSVLEWGKLIPDEVHLTRDFLDSQRIRPSRGNLSVQIVAKFL